jgi:hypothetical protein
VDALGVNGGPPSTTSPDHPLAEYWPASRHIIGKDIIWFHCVIWPCMLLSAGVPLPGKVLCLKTALVRRIEVISCPVWFCF